jgi:hypothetical protein
MVGATMRLYNKGFSASEVGPSVQPSTQSLSGRDGLQQIALHRLPHLTMDQHGSTETRGPKGKRNTFIACCPGCR